MKQIKIASVVLAVLFVMVSFTTKKTIDSVYFQFTGTYGQQALQDIENWEAVASLDGCNSTAGHVCTLILSTAKSLGQQPDSGEFGAVADDIDDSFTAGSSTVPAVIRTED